jgi:hypothetical protein
MSFQRREGLLSGDGTKGPERNHRWMTTAKTK